MSSYKISIEFGVLSFPLIALLFTIPYMIYQYRKFGSIPFWKTFVVYAFIFYGICAYYLVILPLPESRDAIVAYAANPRLVPFTFIKEIAAQASLVGFSLSNPATWLSLIKSAAVYEVFFNMLLTVPLGLFLKYFFHRRWWQVLLIGFATTLFFETSQITGLWGFYQHPYRLFDVDDLIVNTFGAMVGFWVAYPLCHFLPDINELNEKAKDRGEHGASFTRRLLAWSIDVLAVFALVTVALLLASGLGDDQSATLFVVIAAIGVCFMIVPIVTRGQTLGHKVLKLRIVHPDATPAHWYNYIIRYGLLYWVFLMLPLWASYLLPASFEGVKATSVYSVLVLMYAVWLLSIFVRAIRSARKHPFVMLNGLVSNTRVMSTTQIERLLIVSRARHATAEEKEEALSEEM